MENLKFQGSAITRTIDGRILAKRGPVHGKGEGKGGSRCLRLQEKGVTKGRTVDGSVLEAQKVQDFKKLAKHCLIQTRGTDWHELSLRARGANGDGVKWTSELEKT